MEGLLFVEFVEEIGIVLVCGGFGYGGGLLLESVWEVF